MNQLCTHSDDRICVETIHIRFMQAKLNVSLKFLIIQVEMVTKTSLM